MLAGGVVGDLEALGLDAAFPALFVWLLRDLLEDRAAVLAALTGGIIALTLSPLLPAAVLVAAIVSAGLRAL